MAMALLVPCSVYCVEALGLLAEEQAIHDHTEGPDIKCGGLIKELEVKRLWSDEWVVKAGIGEIVSVCLLGR